MNRILKVLLSRKEFVLYSFMRITVMLLSLVSNIFIVRRLSVSNYGIFSIANMFIGLLTTFGFSWSSSSIIYYGSREKAETGVLNRTFWARNLIMFAGISIMTLVFILFSDEINTYIGEDLSGLLLFWLLISVAEDYLIQYFLSVKKQLYSGMLSITAKIIYIIFVVIIVYDVKALIILNIISHASVLLYIFFVDRKDIGHFTFDRKWFQDILHFSLWQLFGYSGLYLINFGDTAVIKYFMTTEDIGVYNVAYKLFSNTADLSYVISSFFASQITECFSKGDSKGIRDFFYRERFYIMLLCLFAHAFVIIFADRILMFLYGNSYSGTIGIFRVLMVGSVFRYASIFYMLYYNICKMNKIFQLLNLYQAIFNLLLDIILIKSLGLMGPAIATVISIACTTVFSALYCEKRIRKKAML